MSLLTIVILVIIPTISLAGSINFEGGTWTIQRYQGDPIKVKKVEIDSLDDGKRILIYTLPDGAEGFVNTSNVKNLKQLLQMAETGKYAESEPEPELSENQIKYNRLKAEQERLGQEIARREQELDHELNSMASEHDQVYYFPSSKYCKEVSTAVGGSYQIEKGCMMNEENAKASLDRMSIPARIVKYCEEVSNAVGGSYQIMYGCVRNELNAKNSLR